MRQAFLPTWSSTPAMVNPLSHQARDFRLCFVFISITRRLRILEQINYAGLHVLDVFLCMSSDSKLQRPDTSRSRKPISRRPRASANRSLTR